MIQAFGDDNLNELREHLYVDLKEINSEIQDFISVDTLARSFFLSGDYSKLSLVKKAIEIFILYEEITKGIDKRYDLFFSTLLDRKGDNIFFPSKINIISWNFDIQIERSLSRLTGFSISQIKNIAGLTSFFFGNLNLKNLYIQVPEEDFQGVEERIKSQFFKSTDIKTKDFIPIKGLNEFYIPTNYHED